MIEAESTKIARIKISPIDAASTEIAIIEVESGNRVSIVGNQHCAHRAPSWRKNYEAHVLSRETSFLGSRSPE